MKPTVHQLIKPLTIRFSLWDGNPIYHFSGEPDTQLDGIENMMEIDIENNPIFDTNLGFLPISSSTLIKGEKNIVVDPGNFHMGNYGMVERGLRNHDMDLEDIDIVVVTHNHLDHMASTFLFEHSELAIGEGELDVARETMWPSFVDAITVDRVEGITTVGEDDGKVELCEGVSVFFTPGHTPASISLFVETETDDVAVIGDVAMTESDYTDRELSHWYTDEQVELIHESLNRIQALEPTMVIPGHDFPFDPR